MSVLVFDFQLYASLYSHPNDNWNGGKVRTGVFQIPIYEFNIYLFFKKSWRQLLEKSVS